MKASIVCGVSSSELLVMATGAHPGDSRVQMQTRHWTVYMDAFDARQLAGALVTAARDVEDTLRAKRDAGFVE